LKKIGFVNILDAKLKTNFLGGDVENVYYLKMVKKHGNVSIAE
jgi:hypothetical protein